MRAQGVDEKTVSTLAYFISLKGYDLKCNVLSPTARIGMDAYFARLVRQLKSDEEFKNKVREMWKSQGASPDIVCSEDKEIFEDGVKMFREMAAEQDASIAQAQAMSDPEWGLKAVREAIDKLPKGRIENAVGCHSGKISEWPAELCVSVDGAASLKISNPKTGVVCDLSQGQARKREAGIYFYATNAKRQCSDGSQLTHAEGGCQILSGALGCLIGAYKVQNIFYVFRGSGSEEVVNGHVRLAKAKNR